jgi:hypothetical protein
MENYWSKANVEMVNKFILELANVLSAFHDSERKKANGGKELNKLQRIANQFLDRSIMNITAIRELLPAYSSKSFMIFPIGLIMRSVCSDFVTLLYLLSFTKRGTEINATFETELDMLDRDLIKTYFEMKQIESELPNYVSILPIQAKGKQDIDDQLSQLRTGSLKRYFTANGKLKQSADIRIKADRSMYVNPDLTKPHSFMSDSYKWKQVSTDDTKKFIFAYYAYKTFSTFQHYSPVSYQLINGQQEAFLFSQFLVGVNSIFLMLDLIIQIIDHQDSEFKVKANEVSQRLSSELTNAFAGKKSVS